MPRLRATIGQGQEGGGRDLLESLTKHFDAKELVRSRNNILIPALLHFHLRIRPTIAMQSSNFTNRYARKTAGMFLIACGVRRTKHCATASTFSNLTAYWSHGTS